MIDDDYVSPPGRNPRTIIGYPEKYVRELEQRNATLVEALERIIDHDPRKPGITFDSYSQLVESMIEEARAALKFPNPID